MTKQEWLKKLAANGIDCDSLKPIRARICRLNGFNSISEISEEVAENLIAIILESLVSHDDFF
jgi:hypothetical protein